jgi:hypothetical protein
VSCGLTDVGLVTEEVVETMIIGEAPFNVTLDANLSHDASTAMSRRSIATRRSRFIILDIGDYDALACESILCLERIYIIH